MRPTASSTKPSPSEAVRTRLPPPTRLEGYPEAGLDEVQKGALVMLVMNRDVGDPNRDIGDPGGRDFKFGLTGMLLMVGAAVILMVVS